MGIGDFLGGAAEGILQSGREANQSRLQNMQVWQNYVRFNAELGLTPSPAEMSQHADRMTGGDNWLRRQLPAAEVMQSMSQSLRQRADQMQEQQSIQTARGRAELDTLFGTALDDFIINARPGSDINGDFLARYDRDPRQRQAAENYLRGQDINQRRSTAISRRAEAVPVGPEDTPESIAARLQGQNPELIAAVQARASVNVQARRRTNTERAIESANLHPEQWAGVTDAPSLQRAVQARYGSDVDADRVLPAIMAVRQRGQDVGAAAALEVTEPDLQEIQRNGHAVDPVTRERVTARLRLAGRDWSPAVEQRLVEQSMAREVQQRQALFETQSREARTAAGTAWTSEEQRSRDGIKSILAPSGSRASPRRAAVSDLLANSYYVPPESIGRVSDIATQLIDSMPSDASPGAVAQAIAQQAGLQTFQVSRDLHIARRLRDGGHVAPQLFRDYETNFNRGLQQRTQEARTLLDAATTSQTAFTGARDTVLRTIDSDLAEMQRERDGRANLVGYNEERFQAARQRLVELRASVAAEHPNPNRVQRDLTPEQQRLQRYGPDDPVVDMIEGAESRDPRTGAVNPAAANPRSSARGSGQFLDETWLEMARQFGPQLGLDAGLVQAATRHDFDPEKRRELLAMRTDATPEGRQRMRAAIGLNAGRTHEFLLQSNGGRGIGREITRTDIYLGHFLGQAGGLEFVNAYNRDPSRIASGVVGRRAATANDRVFTLYDDAGREVRQRTLGEVYDLFTRRLNRQGGRGTSSPTPPSSGILATPPVQRGEAPTLRGDAAVAADRVQRFGARIVEGASDPTTPFNQATEWLGRNVPAAVEEGVRYLGIGRTPATAEGVTPDGARAIERERGVEAARTQTARQQAMQIRQLPSNQREGAIMRSIAGRSVSEVGEILDALVEADVINGGEAASYMSRARRGVRGLRPTG